MKVCIISPSIFYFGNIQPFARFHIPYLHSYLRQKLPAVEVSVLDLEVELGHANTQKEVDDFLRMAELRLRRIDFDVVGISCWTSLHYLSTMAMARLCKHLNPDCAVVVGGYHPSLVPQDFEGPDTPVDYIVQGEGEEAFRRIVAGEVPHTPRPQRVPGIPVELTDLHLLWDEYPYYRNAGAIGVWLSRGCPFSCSYCLDRQTRYRGYTARQAISELQRILKLLPNLHQILMCDALFGLSKEWRREFLPLLVEMKPDVELWTETRVDLIQPEDLDLIARLRFQLDLGLEHVSPRMLTIMKKTNNPQKYLQCFETVDAYMNEKWIPHMLYLMFNYPGETSETQQQLYDYLVRYYERNPHNWTHASTALFSFYPGAEVYTNWKHYEETYGARVLYPEWWKIPDLYLQDFTGAIIPSRELMEAGLVHRGLEFASAVRMYSLQFKHPQLEERHPGGFGRSRSLRQIDSGKDGYLDDKPLQLQELSCIHEKVDANMLLYNFESGGCFHASRTVTETLRAVLEKGLTINNLVEQYAAVYPNPETQRQKLRKLFWDLVLKRFLTLNLAPAEPLPDPPDRPRVVLNTTAGRIVLELYGREVPRTVANFLYLVRRGFYNGLHFFKAVPETFVQVGSWAYLGSREGPGYVLELEPSPFACERGSVSALQVGQSLHGSQLYIWRSPQSRAADRSAVFGHVAAGMEAIDRILANQDWILEATVAGEPGGGAETVQTAVATTG